MSHMHSSGAPTTLSGVCGAKLTDDPAHWILSCSERLDYAENAPACLAVASGGGLYEGYGHDI